MRVGHHRCVPIIFSERMEMPFSAILDWSTFSVRLKEAQLPALKTIVQGLDHAKLLRGLKLARSAIEYHVGQYDGADMLPLLLHQMHARLAAGPITRPLNVLPLLNDVDTDRDYDAEVHNEKTQCAHAVSTASAMAVDGVRWDCVSTDGYQASCSTQGAAVAAKQAARVSQRPRRCRKDLKARGWE